MFARVVTILALLAIAVVTTAAALRLAATTRMLDIGGRAATFFGLAGPSGQGLILDPGQRFRIDLTNELDIGTIIHWHGQIPPNAQDGVPDMPMPLLAPGMTHGAMQGMDGQMGMGNMQGMGGMQAMGGMAMGGMQMDLNDFNWDAYLANDRTLSDPEVVQVERGGRIRLRVINAVAATVFWIDTGALGACAPSRRHADPATKAQPAALAGQSERSALRIGFDLQRTHRPPITA